MKGRETRTQGTFKDVYEAAKSYSNGKEGRPSDPVIRHLPDGIWMLESSINPEPDADAECRLEHFDNYFFETYSDDSYTPDKTDEREFLESIKKEEEW